MGRNVVGLDLTRPQPWPRDTQWLPTFMAVWYAAATFMVAQRLFLRLLRFGSPLGWDDALIFGGWVASTAFFIEATLMATHHGNAPTVQPWEFEFIALMLWCVELSFFVTQWCIKLSVLVILNRFVKETADTRIRYAIRGAATLTSCYTLAMFIAALMMCSPINAYWRAFSPEYAANNDFRCWNQQVSNIMAGVATVVADLYTIAIPWAISRSFGLTKRQTLALNVVFMFGLIVTAASCLRTYYFYYMLRGENVPQNLVNLAIWATVEIQLAIICACMPSLRVLYRLIVRARLSRVARQRLYIRREPLDSSGLEEERLPSFDREHPDETPMKETSSETTTIRDVSKHDVESLSTPSRSAGSFF